MSWEGNSYQGRFDALESAGTDVHGEASFVHSLRPTSALDAGCGTGRVALELHRRGIEVAGVDLDPSMLAVARRRGPGLAWLEADLASLDLGRDFDVVVMAGNVLLFTAPGSEAAVVAGCARHVAVGGALVAGFQIEPVEQSVGGGRHYELTAYDSHCSRAGLALEGRWATWDREPFGAGGSYAVSLHRRWGSAPGE